MVEGPQTGDTSKEACHVRAQQKGKRSIQLKGTAVGQEKHLASGRERPVAACFICCLQGTSTFGIEQLCVLDGSARLELPVVHTRAGVPPTAAPSALTTSPSGRQLENVPSYTMQGTTSLVVGGPLEQQQQQQQQVMQQQQQQQQLAAGQPGWQACSQRLCAANPAGPASHSCDRESAVTVRQLSLLSLRMMTMMMITLGGRVCLYAPGQFHVS
eukprot:1133943-Pelagomonas_calceolata.AAC.1